MSFPTLFGATPPADQTAPYTAIYTIVDSSNTDGSYNISTMDNVDNSFSGAPVTVRKDFINPTVSLAVEEAAGFAFNLTLSSQDNLSGPSGVYDVEYRVGNPECSAEGMGPVAPGRYGRLI